MVPRLLVAAGSFALFASGAEALTVNVVDGNTDGGESLVGVLLGGSSGLTVTNSSFTGAGEQSGTYSGFSSVGLGNHGNGVVLSSGNAGKVPLTNTEASWDSSSIGELAPQSLPGGSTDDADLVALLQSKGNNQQVNDVNVLEFSFTVDDPSQNSVSANFVYGTEEFPDQNVTDIFGFFVDGINYAFFADGSLINFNLGGANAGFYNSNLNGDYKIEWDGLTDILKVTGLLDSSLAEHTIKIAIADTSDTAFDSAVYLSSLSAGVSEGDGGIGDPDDPDPEPSAVPLPASLPLFLAALGGLGLLRRRPRRD